MKLFAAVLLMLMSLTAFASESSIGSRDSSDDELNAEALVVMTMPTSASVKKRMTKACKDTFAENLVICGVVIPFMVGVYLSCTAMNALESKPH